MFHPADSIDDVIQYSTAIIEWSKSESSRLGYFAALYRKVTCRVKERIEAGDFFEDNQRMERLDVTFANRYLNEIDHLRAGGTPIPAWDYSFRASREWWPIVLQHLLLGINAHINLDLGIAAVETMENPEDLPDLRNDFNSINRLLSELVGEVQSDLAWIWPPLRWLNRRLGNVETVIINFSMETAREEAWAFAQQLASLDPVDRPAAIERRDEVVTKLAEKIRYPGWFLNALVKVIRLGERGSVSKIIETLE